MIALLICLSAFACITLKKGNKDRLFYLIITLLCIASGVCYFIIFRDINLL